MITTFKGDLNMSILEMFPSNFNMIKYQYIKGIQITFSKLIYFELSPWLVDPKKNLKEKVCK